MNTCNGSKLKSPGFKIRQHSADRRNCPFHLVHACWWRKKSWSYRKWKTAFRTGVFNNLLLTYTMEQSLSWKANRFSASQEIPHILWNPKIHYRIHKFPKVSAQVQDLLYACFVTRYFLRWRVVITSPTPQAGRLPLVGCLRQLIQYIHSYPLHWRPFLYPQPEDAPCRGDRDPLITANHPYSSECVSLKRDLFASTEKLLVIM
jgi:hypothetical protein